MQKFDSTTIENAVNRVKSLLCQEKLQSVMTQKHLEQMSQILPESIYSDSSRTITISTSHLNIQQVVNPHIQHGSNITTMSVVTQQVPQETNKITPAKTQTSAQGEENILSQAVLSIM